MGQDPRGGHQVLRSDKAAVKELTWQHRRKQGDRWETYLRRNEDGSTTYGARIIERVDNLFDVDETPRTVRWDDDRS